MKKFFIVCFVLVLIFATLAGGATVALYVWASKDLPSFKRLTDYRPPLVTTVYTHDGEVLGYLYREKRFLVTLKELPPYLPKAFLAAEDNSFYEHPGIDITAILRAMIKNLKAGGIKQGGSTITQQIIKRMLLTSEKKYERKLKEAILAYRLENYLSKDEILTIYLNDIYLGAGSYGVEAAARQYFGKHASELTLAESAILAGLPKAPATYDPYRYPEEAKGRQRYVLDQMLSLKWITPEEYEQALKEPLVYKSMLDLSWSQGAYYLEEVRRWLIDYLSRDKALARGATLDKYGEDAAYEAGLHVQTGVDMVHQNAAEKALRDGLVAASKRSGWQGPVKHIDPLEYESFLAGEHLSPEILEPGEWLQCLVTDVDKRGAKVRVGQFRGFISVETMSWARKPDKSRAPESVPAIKDATIILKPGDVVWASVCEPKPEPKADPKADKGNAAKPQPPKPQAGQGTLDLALEQHPRLQGAFVSLEPPTGEVRALVGGYAFKESQFNRATQAQRQPGSAFKPIVYSAALDHGFTAASVVMDAPFVTISGGKVWKPENYSGKFEGPTLLRTALVKSKNLVTIRVAQRMGIRYVIERAKALGLTPDFPPNLAISLGAVALAPINLCQAYTAFARGGSTIAPRMVLSVRGPWGEDYFTSQPEIKDALTPQNAYIMASLLKEVVQHGTATQARVLNRPVAGKTGTTNDEQDAWFMGFSPYLLSGVFVGYDQLEPMGKLETGSRAALPIWIQYRKAVEPNYPIQDFPEPPGIVHVRVNAKTGLPSADDSESFFLPFMTGTEPSGAYIEPLDGSDPVPVTPGAPGTPGTTPTPPSRGEDLLKQFF